MSAAGNDIRLPAFGAQLFSHLLHFAHHVGTAGHYRDGLHAKQLEQEIIAGRLGRIAVLHPFLEHQMAVKAFMNGPGEGQTAMVGLYGAAGDQGICALIQSIGDAEIQLAGLVAAAGAGKQVVTLDIDIDTSIQGLGEVRQKSMGVGSVT